MKTSDESWALARGRRKRTSTKGNFQNLARSKKVVASQPLGPKTVEFPQSQGDDFEGYERELDQLHDLDGWGLDG